MRGNTNRLALGTLWHLQCVGQVREHYYSRASTAVTSARGIWGS